MAPQILTMQESSKDSKEEVSREEEAVRKLRAKYDSYRGLLQLHGAPQPAEESHYHEASINQQLPSLQVTEDERQQTEAFFRGLRTHVFVSGALANLYEATAASPSAPGQQPEPATEEWQLKYTGLPVLILDTGEARRRRGIQLVLAERGSCFALWRDTIDNLTAYRGAGPAFHVMHLSTDHRKLVGLSFDTPEAADTMMKQVEELTSRPENICLSAPKSSRAVSPARRPKRVRPPCKSQISQPACFQHVVSVAPQDREKLFSLQTLLPPATPPQQRVL